ncbi:amidohydrolase family protein [Mycobacterium intracellulare 1956]|uniref:Amidohydrolase family protein n=1 Tax=Mycobacterium intracellulare 1956 TaxID=1299331 RepID=X8CN27_MYCIT|nr:amidohydrolase family protein [Mycobacterium intracellulare 1956]
MPDRHLGSALHAAHNEMMVSNWLESSEFGERFRGTIRVNPDDIPGALREIERWRSHPRVVQIGVPLQSRELYGKPQFWPIWEAAVDAGLPVAAHIEVGSGIAFAPTPSGNTRTYEQYVSFMALNYLYHLMNMIAEGVFERFDGLKFVWGDGARRLRDAVHLADGHLRPAAPGADAVVPADPQRLSARPRVFRPGQPRRPRRRRVRRRMVRLHRQGRHGDVRLQLSALAVRRYHEAAPRPVRRAAREVVLAKRRAALRHRHSRRGGRTVEVDAGGPRKTRSFR